MHISSIYILLLIGLLGNVSAAPENGDKYPLGMNLAGVHDWSTQFPFLDLSRQARKWISQMEGRPWGKGGGVDLDQHGWVRSLRPGQSVDWIFISRNGPLPDEKFVVWYEGEGKVTYSGIVKKIRSLGERRDLLKVKKGARGKYAILSIKKTNKLNPVRDIHIVPMKYMGRFSRGETFNPEWIDYIRRFEAVRFMNWIKTNGSEISTWSDRPKVTDYTWSIKGVPIEIIIALANRINSDVWLTIPHLANKDYVQRLAKYVTSHLRDGLRVYLEHSNEVWNWRYPQTHYASEKAEQMWGKNGSGHVQWHAVRTVNVCSWWKEAQSGLSNPPVCVLGLQAGWSRMAEVALECPLWKKGPCYKKGIDAVAIAAYFTGCLDGVAGWKRPDQSERIRSWFMDQDGGMHKAYEQTLNGKHFECARSVSSMFEKYRNFKRIAAKYGMKLLAYEGGQHVTGNGHKIQNDKDFVRFHLRFNRTDYMRKLTLANFEKWKIAGGELFMYFDDVGAPSKWGSFGSMDYIGDYASPKYRAIVEFGQKNRRWW